MKKLFRTFMVLSLATATVFTSCKKDEETEPEPTIDDVTVNVTGTPSDADVVINSDFKLVIQATGNEKNQLKHIKVTNSKDTKTLLDKDLTGVSASEIVDYKLSSLGANVFTVIVSSTGEGKVDVTKSYTVNVKLPTTYRNFEPIANITLGAQSSGVEQFLDIHAGVSYAHGNGDAKTNSALIDFAYGYGTSNTATLFAPNEGTFHVLYDSPTDKKMADWATKNATKMVEVTSFITPQMVEGSTNDSLIVVHQHLLDNSSTAKSYIPQLTPNRVIMFRTAKSPSKTGFIIVRNVNATPSGATGDMEISYVRTSN